MPYSEPPPFYMPVRQALGAVLLETRRPREAEAVYLEDLRIYPKNGWSLYGLSKSYAAQGKAGQARATRNGFQQAWARADVELQASRF
jgi:predicted Zn-dependent protease